MGKSEGEGDGSVGKGACRQDWPESLPWTHSRRRTPTPAGCPLTFTHAILKSKFKKKMNEKCKAPDFLPVSHWSWPVSHWTAALLISPGWDLLCDCWQSVCVSHWASSLCCTFIGFWATTCANNCPPSQYHTDGLMGRKSTGFHLLSHILEPPTANAVSAVFCSLELEFRVQLFC